MSDMNAVIQPKSDQLNADDLIGGPRTITITRVELTPGTEQPVSVFFEGDGGKPYKSCKSMSRVMVYVWGNESKSYAGRSMTIYRDPDVTWGGMAVGGIRISHMSGITEPIVMALTATKKARKPYRVLPLVVAMKPQPEPAPDPVADWAQAQIARLDAADTYETAQALVGHAKLAEGLARMETTRPELYELVEAAKQRAMDRIVPPTVTTAASADDDGWPSPNTKGIE